MTMWAVFCLAAQAVIIDRIAIVVGNHIVKDSDIERDIRITSFLNNEQLDFSLPSRKKAASRLIDQQIIRDEIESGEYSVAPASEADAMLAQIKRERYPTAERYRQALAHYGIDDADLKNALMWQTTVLRFIDSRFRPGVLVTDADIQSYYTAHQAELRREYPNAADANAMRPDIEDIIAGERVNQQFYAWLEEQRKQVRVEYREESLQ